MSADIVDMGYEVFERRGELGKTLAYAVVRGLCENAQKPLLCDFSGGAKNYSGADLLAASCALAEIHSTTFVTGELKEFFHTFDSVFLKLYPKFIEQFNTLLQEDERICPKEGELLTPELRVFALIRLGITDSGKIANFLHYSAQTVYNYRLKVRNKSLLSKDDFMEAVQQIG